MARLGQVVALTLAVALSPFFMVLAQTAPPAPLADEQSDIARRYAEFENVVQRMTELLARSDPERAALMKRVFAQARQQLLVDQFQKVGERLKAGDLPAALKSEDALLADLASLLDLLLSEDRSRLLQRRREMTEKLAEEVRSLRARQRELRGDVERMEKKEKDKDGPRVVEEQRRLADRTGAAREKLGEAGDPTSEGNDEKPKDAKDSKDAKSGKDSKDSKDTKDSKSTPEKPNKSSGEEGGGKAEKSGEEKASEKLNDAAKAMKLAAEKLRGQQNKDAGGKQDQALNDLDQALRELEEILRQLREEERIERLTALHTRCRKMLEIQLIVYEGTTRLAESTRDQAGRTDQQKALALSRREETILGELDPALAMLREDGSAVVMLEALSGIDADVRSVIGALAKGDVGASVQGTESDIIANLEDIIGSLDRQIREGAKKGKSPGGKGGSGGRHPLVDQLAELKLVRSLQHRVRDRLARLAVDPGKPGAESRVTMIRDLAERQSRLYGITKELSAGRRP